MSNVKNESNQEEWDSSSKREDILEELHHKLPKDKDNPFPDDIKWTRETINMIPNQYEELKSISIKLINEINNVGIKYDQGKPRVSLLSSIALLEVAKVATFGANKYQDHNWRKAFKWSRLLDAALRHILAYNGGNRIDEESGLSHLNHAAWNLLALIEFENTNNGEDDLWSTPQ